MISTQNLAAMPDVPTLQKRLQSLAMLDAILCPDWQFRWYSFNSRWSDGMQLGSMRNGHGDDFFALFNTHGCFFKGFAHEAPMTPYAHSPKKLWPGLIETVPPEFSDCLKEPAFVMDDTTFCIWRRYVDCAWQIGHIEFPPGADPDGSKLLLSPLDGCSETYQEWASWYFNKPFVTVDMIRPIIEHRPLTDELVAELTQDIILEDEDNPHLGVMDLEEDIAEIGYPTK